MTIRDLPIGGRFRLAGLPTLTGTLFSLSESSALVRYDRGETVEVGGRSFTRHHQQTIALSTAIEPIGEVAP